SYQIIIGLNPRSGKMELPIPLRRPAHGGPNVDPATFQRGLNTRIEEWHPDNPDVAAARSCREYIDRHAMHRAIFLDDVIGCGVIYSDTQDNWLRAPARSLKQGGEQQGKGSKLPGPDKSTHAAAYLSASGLQC